MMRRFLTILALVTLLVPAVATSAAPPSDAVADTNLSVFDALSERVETAVIAVFDALRPERLGGTDEEEPETSSATLCEPDAELRPERLGQDGTCS